MTVYVVDTFATPPDKRFRYFAQLDPRKQDEEFLFGGIRGQPLAAHWKSLQLHFQEPLWPRADFYCLSLGTFVCTERAKDLVGEILRKAGELLVVNVEGEKQPHYLFNVTASGAAAFDAYSDGFRTAIRF